MDENNFIQNSSTQGASTNVEKVDKIIDDHLSVILEAVFYSLFGGIISLFGMIANIINMVIFFKHGLDNAMNISLFALAISDFGSLLFVAWIGVLVNPLLHDSGIPFHYREMLYMSAGWQQKCFVRITSFITIYITSERLLSIMLPLKVKQIVTPRRTKLFIVTIYLIVWVPILPDYTTFYVDWKFYPDKNTTLLGMKFNENRETIGPVIFFIQAFISGVPFPILIILTSLLVWKLKANQKWRKSATSNAGKIDSSNVREKKIMIMVTLIAAINILCYTPGVILFTFNFTVPEMSVHGKYSNAFFSLWSIAFVSEAINSSVNIFIYHKMSSKYRATYRELFFSTCKVFNGNEINKRHQSKATPEPIDVK